MPIPGLYAPPALSGTLSPFSTLPGRQIQLGGINLNYVDANAVEWHTEGDLVGWWDSPEITAVTSQRGNRHGTWSGKAFVPNRTVTLSLFLRAPSVDALDQALATLSANVAFDETTPLIVSGNPTTFAYFRRSGAIIANRKGAGAHVSVVLYASDPRRYVYSALPVSGGLGGAEPGLTLPVTLPVTFPAWQPGGQLTGTFLGQAKAPWIATIQGYVQNPVLSNNLNSDQISLNLTVNDGDFVVVNSLQQTVMYNGLTDLSGTVLPGSKFFELDPTLGPWSVQYTGTSATGHTASSISFLVRDNNI